MNFDPRRYPVARERYVAYFAKELAQARKNTPIPFLPLETGLSLTEAMHICKVTAKELKSSAREIYRLERTGAALEIFKTLKCVREGDPLLENIYGLLAHAHDIMKRYSIPLSFFNVENAELKDREHEHWRQVGLLFVDRLQQTEGVRGKPEVRVWYLHEIRNAMMKGEFTRAHLGFEESLHRDATYQLSFEIGVIRGAISRAHPFSKQHKALIEHRDLLLLLASKDLAEYNLNDL